MKQAFFLVFFTVFSAAVIHAQDSTKTIRKILEEKRYSFEPTSMTPMRGSTRQITGGFSLDVQGDTLRVYLPYIGRAYSAPYGSSDAGYDFTSTNYEYEIKEGKKKSYNVTMKVKDRSASTTFYFTIYDNGSASLRANSSDKQDIAYNGYIKEPKQKKESKN